MGLLDGDLARSLYDGFRNRLLSGSVVRKPPASSGALDDHGDPLDLDKQRWSIEGFVDVYSRGLRATAGIPQSALKVSIFAQSAPSYAPHKDDVVTLGTRTMRLTGEQFDIDPAGALWTCQAEEIAA